jgi:Zn finger protein HypA/HybF involved in hydrogenase expression
MTLLEGIFTTLKYTSGPVPRKALVWRSEAHYACPYCHGNVPKKLKAAACPYCGGEWLK